MGKEIVISKARGKKQKNGSQNLCHRLFHPEHETTRPKKLAWIDLKMVREKIKEIGIKLEK